MQQFARSGVLLLLLAPASGLPLFGHSFRPVLSTKVPDTTKLPEPVEKPQNDVEAVAQQEEASIEQVEADLKRLDTFGASVTKDLEAQAHAVADVQHALGYFRQQTQLQRDERDIGKAKVQDLQEEVAALTKRIQSLESDKRTLQEDKRTLTDANQNLLAKFSSLFASAKAVESGLAFQGLAAPSNATAPVS